METFIMDKYESEFTDRDKSFMIEFIKTEELKDLKEETIVFLLEQALEAFLRNNQENSDVVLSEEYQFKDQLFTKLLDNWNYSNYLYEYLSAIKKELSHSRG